MKNKRLQEIAERKKRRNEGVVKKNWRKIKWFLSTLWRFVRDVSSKVFKTIGHYGKKTWEWVKDKHRNIVEKDLIDVIIASLVLIVLLVIFVGTFIAISNSNNSSNSIPSRSIIISGGQCWKVVDQYTIDYDGYAEFEVNGTTITLSKFRDFSGKKPWDELEKSIGRKDFDHNNCIEDKKSEDESTKE